MKVKYKIVPKNWSRKTLLKQLGHLTQQEPNTKEK
jgi:hypothetical protein